MAMDPQGVQGQKTRLILGIVALILGLALYSACVVALYDYANYENAG
jgi:hypothetical protein